MLFSRRLTAGIIAGCFTFVTSRHCLAAPESADTVRAGIISMTPDRNVVQGTGQFSRTVVYSVALDETAVPAARLDTFTLTCRIEGPSSVAVTGIIPASLKNGSYTLDITGLRSGGQPLVATKPPTIIVDTKPPDLDAAAILINGKTARFYNTDTLAIDIGKAIDRADAVAAAITVDDGSPVEMKSGKAVLTGLSEGAHRIVIIVKDKAGNPGSPAELPVILDRTPPNMTNAAITVGSGKTIVSSSKTIVKISGITDNNGVRTIWYRVAAASPRKMSADSFVVQLDRDRTDSLCVWADDSAGNVSERLCATITRDTKAPSATAIIDRLWGPGDREIVWHFDEPMDTTIPASVLLDSVEITVRWIEHDKLHGVVRIDTSSVNGNRQLTLVSAQDLAGNSCKQVKNTVTVDTRAPKLTLENIILNKGILAVSCDSAPVAVTGVTDPGGVAQYRFSLAGSPVEETASPQIMLRALKNGTHELTVSVTDGAGNVSAPVTLGFTVDNSRPAVDKAAAGPCDTSTFRIPVILIFTKVMDAEELPRLSVDNGSLTDAHWSDSITLSCAYDPESKGAVDTIRIGLKGGRDRGGFTLGQTETSCAIGTDTILRCARLMSEKGRHKQAAGLLERLSGTQPYRADIAETWAEEARADNDRKGERAAMERLAQLRPADKELLRSLVSLTSQMGDRRASKTWLKQLMVADGKMETVSTADYRREGRSFFRMDPGACLVPVDGGEGAQLIAEGAAAAQAGDLKTAHEAFVAALTLDSSLVEAVYNIATLRLLEGKPLEAEADLARCAGVSERFAGNYAVAMAMSGRLDAALKLFTERKISLDDPALAGVYGVLLIRSGKTSEALPYLEKASEIGTAQRINYAFGLYTAKEYDRSLALFKSCGTAAADTFPEICYGKALAELKLGDRDAAVADLQAAVAIQPVYLDAQLKLGELLMKRKDRAGARHALSFAARADSTSRAAHQALAAFYRETGESELARSESMIAARPLRKESDAMTIAVEQFRNITRDSSVEWLSVGMAEALSTEMNRFSPYRMLERLQIEKIMKQRELTQATGDEAEALDTQLGKVLGAQGIVTGSYQAAGKVLRIDGRLIEVETGNILMTASTNGTMDELSRMQRTLALTLSGKAEALELVELPGGVSADAQQRMALAKKALYDGNAEEAKKLAGEALLIDPQALSLAGSMAVAMADEGRGKSMAVLEFENLSGMASDAGMGSGIQEALITNLRKAGNLSIVERAQIDKLSDEIGLAQSGLVNESSAATVGNMLAAGVLLAGGYHVSGNKIRITAKLLDAVTAEILLATDVNGKKEALFELEDQLAARILAALRDAPAADTAEQIDPTLKRGIDTAAGTQAQDAGKEEQYDYGYREETLSRRLAFFVSPAGLNLRFTGFSTINGDAGFHFLNEHFAIDGLFEISMDNIVPKLLKKSFFTGKNDVESVDILYRAIEVGAGWNFFRRWSNNEKHVSFYQVRAGYKSLQAPGVAIRSDSLPPYLGGTAYPEDDANVTLNTSQGIIYAGLAVARKTADKFTRKTLKFHADFLFAPYLAYDVTGDDGVPWDGYYNALTLQRTGGRIGLERTSNHRFGLHWFLEAGVRPGIYSANESNMFNLYLSAKIGVSSSWF